MDFCYKAYQEKKINHNSIDHIEATVHSNPKKNRRPIGYIG